MLRGARHRLAIDVGGTFTDVVVDSGDGTLTIEKVLTTSAAPEVGAREGAEAALAASGASVADVALAAHGTTLVTNAIIERRGARVGMITTEGFEDALEIGRGERYDMYDLFLPFPEPLVERRLRLGVPERVDAGGAELAPLDEGAVLDALAELIADDVEAVAVCFIHAYANPGHERRAAALIREQHPQLAVSLSTEVAGQLGEFERFSTTVANAYVQPLADRYLQELDRWLAGGRLLLMASNGGTISVDAARRQPITMVESGPAAGALAAAAYARRLGKDRVVSFDMGGTTAKVCLIDDAEPMMSPDFEAARAERFKPGSGIPLRIPVVHLIEIGAGGGSIARKNELGLLKVGPRSAGSQPGPACYGRGGTEPTVTDANVLLGFIGASSFLGGSMPLDVDSAAAAVRRLADSLGLDEVRAAWGIHDVVNESMAAAMRSHVAERNRDVRRYSLLAFGGAGPVHALEVARKVGVREVVVPLGAGVTSALGLLTAPTAVDLVQSAPSRLSDVDWPAVEALLGDLEQRARTEIASAGTPPESLSVERAVDMRYVGQAHEITVPLPPTAGEAGAERALREAFERLYESLYAVLNDSFEVEVLHWRVRVTGPHGDVWFTPRRDEGAETTRPVWQPAAAEYLETRVLAQASLQAGTVYEGPLVVEQRETTTILGPNDRATVDELGSLVVEVA